MGKNQRTEEKDERIGKMSTTITGTICLSVPNALMSLVMGDKTRGNDHVSWRMRNYLWGSAFRVAVVEIDDYRDANSLDDKQKQEHSWLLSFIM